MRSKRFYHPMLQASHIHMFQEVKQYMYHVSLEKYSKLESYSKLL